MPPKKALRPRTKLATKRPGPDVVEVFYRTEHVVDSPGRKLDSLARLLEGAGICTAVCIYDNKLLVAANGLPRVEHPRPNALENLITDVLAHFSKIAKAEYANPQDESKAQGDALLSICYQASKAMGVTPQAVADDKVQDFLKKILLNTDGTLKSKKRILSEIGNYSVDKLVKEFGRDGGPQMAKILAITYTRSRDFFKVTKSLKQAGTPLKKALSDKGYSILREGVSGIHAEKRILNHIIMHPSRAVPIERGPTPVGSAPAAPDSTASTVTVADITSPASTGIYIGISKLCCKACYLAIQAVNKSRDRSADAKRQKGSRLEQDIAVLKEIEIRGTHGLGFDAAEPDFLKGEDPISLAYHALLKEHSVAVSEVRADMVARQSSTSDTVHGRSSPSSLSDAPLAARPQGMTITEETLLTELRIRLGSTPHVLSLIEVALANAAAARERSGEVVDISAGLVTAPTMRAEAAPAASSPRPPSPSSPRPPSPSSPILSSGRVLAQAGVQSTEYRDVASVKPPTPIPLPKGARRGSSGSSMSHD